MMNYDRVYKTIETDSDLRQLRTVSTDDSLYTAISNAIKAGKPADITRNGRLVCFFVPALSKVGVRFDARPTEKNLMAECFSDKSVADDIRHREAMARYDSADRVANLKERIRTAWSRRRDFRERKSIRKWILRIRELTA